MTTLLLVFLICSCKKETYPDLKGDYDWAWSATSEGVVLTDISASPDRYGFRIGEKGKVQFYKNGKPDFKGKITEMQQTAAVNTTTIVADHKMYVLFVHNDELHLSGYPFDDCYNYYKK